MASSSKKLAPAKFVTEVVKDPKVPADTLLLFGYPGESSEPGNTRLYFNPQLSNFVDIPDDAILHSQDAPASVSPLGGSYVWIKTDAQVSHSSPSPRRQKGSFLEGTILGGALTATVAAECQNTQIVCRPPTQPPGCVVHTIPDQCGPVTPNCPHTVTAPCVTAQCTIPPHCILHTPAYGCAPTPAGPCVTIHCTIPPQCIVPTPLHGCPPQTLPAVCGGVSHVVCPPPLTINSPNCPVQTAVCQTRAPACGIQTVACASVADGCPSALGCTFPGTYPGTYPVFPGGIYQ
jgi:hypothetical protein